MKKIFLIILFTMLISFAVYASEDYIFIGQSKQQITFDDAKAANQNIQPFSSNVAETINYYDQLTEIEKKYYDDLNSNFTTLMNGTTQYKAIIFDKLPVAAGLDVTTQEGVNALWESAIESINTLYGIDISTLIFRPMYALSSFDQPQYFWTDINKITGGYGGDKYSKSEGLIYNFYITLNVKTKIWDGEKYVTTGYTNYWPDCYTSEAQIKSDYDNMLNKAAEIINSVPEGSTEWEKLNYYMNWLKDNCQYNTYLSSGTESGQAYLPTSALLYGKDGANAPVCEGYSEALKILCNMSGIKTMCTESFYTQNNVLTGHKWNLVNLEGKFYHCDPTWFDTYTTINSYRYFLTGSTNMSSYDKTQNHTIVYQMDFYAPEISATDYLNDIGINSYNILNIDGNNIIDQTDTITLLRRISNISSGTVADINNDGTININDVIKIQQLMFK